ncbi:SUR7/PalI family domain containing protein [Hyaloscypha variabilis]
MRGFIPPVLCLLTLVLIVLVLIAGSSSHVLVDWFFLKADTTGLSVPSKLSSSTYLKALSTVAKTDYVGSNSSASSLGLATSYTISLLSYCAESSTSTVCSKPQFGFHFDPLSDLQLANTGLGGTLPATFTKAISSYGSASKFLGGAYLLAFVLTFLTPLFGILASCCAPRAIIGGAITSSLATIFLLAASALSVAIFKTVKSAFDSDLGPAGIKTSFGDKLYVLTWIATVLSLMSSVLLCASSRSSNRKGKSRGMIIPSSTDKDGSKVGVVSSTAGPRPLTLLQRSLTWNKHKYAQLSAKKKPSPVVKVTGADDYDDEDVLLEQRGFGGGEDEEEEEMVRSSTRGIPLTAISGSKPAKDTDAAYEPFRHV